MPVVAAHSPTLIAEYVEARGHQPRPGALKVIGQLYCLQLQPDFEHVHWQRGYVCDAD